MNQYDVAIIGSGFAGSTLGAILARHGMRVIIFEAGSHPRFAIGESLILETSETMRALAELYDVPEIAYFSTENFMAHIGTSHGVKRHFGFLLHQAGVPHEPRHTLQAVIPREPHGHELHLYRQDSDHYLLTTAISYGAAVRQKTAVRDVEPGSDGVSIVTAAGETIRAGYVVDAAGFRSPLAQKYDLRHHDLHTHSRAIFTHMVDVPPYEVAVRGASDYDLPFPMCEGTLHHLFEGGWLWVIPFDNHRDATNPLCSVGLMLDPRVYPLREDVSPEEEFWGMVERFPGIKSQLAGATPVRDFTRTGRIQYGSRQIVGDRWALLGHAAGFIDPLYSKGLYMSLNAVSLLSHLLLQARESGDYSARAFADLEQVTHNSLASFDRLVANSYKCFAHPKLWQVYAVLWLLGAYTELVKLDMLRARAGDDRAQYYCELKELRLVGGGFPEFQEIARRIDAIVAEVDPHDEKAVDEAASRINDIFDGVPWVAEPFRAVLRGKAYLPRNKLRLSLLKPGAGFMGRGDYRAHFFGEMSLWDVVRYGIREHVLYSALYQRYRHRRQYEARLRDG